MSSRSPSLVDVAAQNELAVSLHRLPPDVRREAESLEARFKSLAQTGAKIRPALREMAALTRFDAESLKRKFYAWQRQGITALIDHRKCRGCGLMGCTAPRAITIPQETLDTWRAGDIGNDKRAMRESWETKIIGALRAGESVPGLGDWRQLHHRLNPFRPIPASCPWHIHNPPPGLSFSNFRRFRSSRGVRLLGKKGEFAAWGELPEVRIDLTQLRPLEWIVFDDHRVDFKVMIEAAPGKFQVCEMWGVFAMDVATREVIAFGLKPRIAREDGTSLGIERRDVQHLIAYILARYGLPKDYDMTLIVENAAAAVTEDTENMLARISNGRVKIKRTGLHASDAMISGFPERWGNYRGKRWLESWFNPFDICLGVVRGQIGSDYWSKPGRADAELRLAEKFCAILGHVSDDERERLTLPFEWAGDVHGIVQAAVDACNLREDHECDGFEPVTFFRWDASDPTPKPLNLALAKLHGTEDALAMFQRAPDELKNHWLSHGFTRRESPHEKFTRMYAKGARFVAVAEETYLHLLLDESRRGDKDGSPIVYKGGDVLDVFVRQGTRRFKARFRGKDHELRADEPVRVVYDSDNLHAGIFITNAAGQMLGRMRYSPDPTHDDLEGLQRMLGDKQRARSEMIAELRRVTLKPAAIKSRAAALDHDLRVLTTVREGARETAPALTESAGLVNAINGTRAPVRRKGGVLEARKVVFVSTHDDEDDAAL